ncbi:hypothetical protein EDC01DRAFT_775729 [Geopyxis carbonaria]|nr:hypothetical protein EDC01DRAFT_775729 [Geopyxis carbonaria]
MFSGVLYKIRRCQQQCWNPHHKILGHRRQRDDAIVQCASRTAALPGALPRPAWEAELRRRYSRRSHLPPRRPHERRAAARADLAEAELEAEERERRRRERAAQRQLQNTAEDRLLRFSDEAPPQAPMPPGHEAPTHPTTTTTNSTQTGSSGASSNAGTQSDVYWSLSGKERNLLANCRQKTAETPRWQSVVDTVNQVAEAHDRERALHLAASQERRRAQRAAERARAAEEALSSLS